MKGILEAVIAKEKQSVAHIKELETSLLAELEREKKELDKAYAKRLTQLQTELSDVFEKEQAKIVAQLEKKQQTVVKTVEKKELSDAKIAQIAKKSVAHIIKNGN